MQNKEPENLNASESGGHPPKTGKEAFCAYLAVGTFLWVVWNESIALQFILQGLLLTWLALTLTSRYFLRANYPQTFSIHPFTLARYVWVLIVAIFQSGIHAMYITLTGKIQIGVIDIPTDLRNPFHAILVANAITLTPGTVTIEHTQGSFKVVWIECLTDDPQKAGELIKGRFERVFATASSRKEGS